MQVDRMKKKDALFSIVRKLTDGIVAERTSWSKLKVAHNKTTVTAATDNTRSKCEPPELYSIQESCRLLQSSYCDLYDDESTAISDSYKDARSDMVDGRLRHSSVQNSEATANIAEENVDSALLDSPGAFVNCSSVSKSDVTVSDVKDRDEASLVETGISYDVIPSAKFDRSSNATINYIENNNQAIPSYDDVLSDSVDDSLSHSFASDADTVVKGNSAALGDEVAVSDSDGEESMTSDCRVDLYSPGEWESYYSRLHQIGREMKGREGWPSFDAVFLISATEDDGVVDVKVCHFCCFCLF